MIGNDFDTPIMHQDLGTYSINPYGIMNGMVGGMYPISYLGGVSMQPQLCQDKLDLINKKEQEGNHTLKKAAIALGALLLIGFIPHIRKNVLKAGGIGKYIGNHFKNLKEGIKNLYNKNKP